MACAYGNALSREFAGGADLVYWAGLALLIAPTLFRLTSVSASPRERFALIGLLALSLYLVKVIRDPMLFTLPDEPIHAYNANKVLETNHLFNGNSILPVTSNFPGLAGATSALAMLSGFSVYVSGTILIGVAKVTFCLALFILFERVGGSAWMAGLAVAVYAASSNFVYFGNQYAYESLSLPLMAVLLAALASREVAGKRDARAWLVPIALVISAIVVTHHLTSYAMVVVLLVYAIACRFASGRRPTPWPIFAFAVAATLAWLLVVASSTVGYLSPVLTSAFEATIETASGEAAPRTLFHSSTGSPIVETPVVARLVSIAAVGLLGLGFLFGLRRTWRMRKVQPFALLFCLGAVGFFGALALRFAPAAWETGNRAGEFFFIGLAFVGAVGAMARLGPGGRFRAWRPALATALVVAVVGGAIAGWPWEAQLAKPLRITSTGQDLDSEPVALGDWAKAHRPDGRFGALASDSRMLLTPGGAWAITDATDGIEPILEEPKLADWMLPGLREDEIRYLVTDRRGVANSNITGYAFTEGGSESGRLQSRSSSAKFARLKIGRLYDSGRIVVYDIGNHP